MLIGDYCKTTKKKYKNYFFSGLSFNSSNCKKDFIFFAIKGLEIDGKKYIKNAVSNGAKIIISTNMFQGLKDGVLYIRSKNVRKSLSEISYKLNKYKPNNLIAVTGTNGKSSIAEFYFQILKLNKKKVASIGTLGIKTNNSKTIASNTTLDPIKLGDILSKLKKKNIDNVILEASSHGIKQNRLDGLSFKVGIFTNLSHDHLDYHKNLNDYLNSKLYLFKKLLKKKSSLITDKKIPEYEVLKNIAKRKKIKLKLISDDKVGISLVSHKYDSEKQLCKIKYKNNFYSFQINLVGKIQIKNILMSILAAEKSGISIQKIINVISKIKPVNGRLEKIGRIKNKACVILDYAHTPDALKTCLENIKEQFNDQKVHIVFGCGGERDKSKRAKMGKIANLYCNKIYLTDDNPRRENPENIRNSIKKTIDKSKIDEIPNRKRAINKAVMSLSTGDILIVAGKGHETTQDYGNSKIFFSDKKVILDIIKKKNTYLSQDIKLNIIKEESGTKNIKKNTIIKNTLINSQYIKKNDIFFAIKGKKKDGNLFLKEVFKKKASLAVVNKIDKSIKIKKQIKVKNTLEFLTKISSILRKNSKAKIIAITGSCGKTSLKELLGKSLTKICKTMYSPKSYNNKYGVPLSLFNLNQKDKFAVLEVGMNKKGEIDELSKIINPEVGVITNISYAHAKNFKNIRQIALAKAEIINNVKKNGFIVLNSDDKFFALHKKIARKNKINILDFSITNKNATINLHGIKKEGKKFKVFIEVNNIKKYFYFSSNFENNIKNLLAAIAVISIFKDIKLLDKNIFYDYTVPSGRGDITKIRIFKKNIFLIDESYNSNLLSLTSAIKNFDLLKIKKEQKHLILGDMLELGKHTKKIHSSIASVINSSSLCNINVIGKFIKETYKDIKNDKKGLILQESSEIFDLIKNNINNNDYLMIKGSNSTGLHELTNAIKKNTYAI